MRPGRYPGNIYGGRFICKAALGDQDAGKGRHLRHIQIVAYEALWVA